jgi:hypothetical protein
MHRSESLLLCVGQERQRKTRSGRQRQLRFFGSKFESRKELAGKVSSRNEKSFERRRTRVGKRQARRLQDTAGVAQGRGLLGSFRGPAPAPHGCFLGRRELVVGRASGESGRSESEKRKGLACTRGAPSRARARHTHAPRRDTRRSRTSVPWSGVELPRRPGGEVLKV